MFQAMRQMIELQKIDLDLAAADSQLGALPEERATVAREIEKLGQLIVACRERIEAEELAERRLEGEMREQEALLKRLNEQTFQIISVKAHDALRHELEHAGTASSELETRALELMERIDGARTELADEEGRLAEHEVRAPEQLAELAERERKLSQERTQLLERRLKECDGIPRDVLSRYDLIAAKRSPAILVLRGSACPTCQMAVPAQRAIEIRRGDLFYTCASCRRILIPEEAIEAVAAEG